MFSFRHFNEFLALKNLHVVFVKNVKLIKVMQVKIKSVLKNSQLYTYFY